MSKDLVTPEGLRPDGRRVGELRKIHLELNPVASANGSCIFSVGNTKVLATVFGPNDMMRGKNPQHAILTVDYSIAPYSGNERRQPASSNPQGGQISNNGCKENAIVLQKLFSSVVLLYKWPNAAIQLSITVLSDQGSVLSAAINAATTAFMLAGIDMGDVVTSASCCVYDGKPLIDATSREIGILGGSTTLAVFNMRTVQTESPTEMITQSGSVVELDEEAALAVPMKQVALLHHTQKVLLDKLQLSLDAANLACSVTHDLIKDHVRQYILDQISA